MRFTEGFLPTLNEDKVRNIFEAAEAMGLIFCQPGRDIEYYRDDLTRWWEGAVVYKIVRNEDPTTEERRAVRRSRNFFQLSREDGNTFVRRNAPDGPALRRYTVEGRERAVMLRDQLEKVS